MIKPKKIILSCLIVFICAVFCFIYYYKTYLRTLYVDKSLAAGVEELPPYVELIVVDVSGEVHEPGLYTLAEGSRINDAIESAGGLTENADTDRLDSLAMKLVDGQKVYVPNIDDDIDKLTYIKENSGAGTFIETSRNTSYESNDILININTASIDELIMLDGIGESTAETIIDYREIYGGFATVEELKNVKGIGDKMFDKFKDNITIE